MPSVADETLLPSRIETGTSDLSKELAIQVNTVKIVKFSSKLLQARKEHRSEIEIIGPRAELFLSQNDCIPQRVPYLSRYSRRILEEINSHEKIRI